MLTHRTSLVYNTDKTTSFSLICNLWFHEFVMLTPTLHQDYLSILLILNFLCLRRPWRLRDSAFFFPNNLKWPNFIPSVFSITFHFNKFCKQLNFPKNIREDLFLGIVLFIIFSKNFAEKFAKIKLVNN